MPKISLFFPDDFEDDAWAEKTFTLEAPKVKGTTEWVLGRGPSCDLVFKIRTVSGRHALIAYSYAADCWSITDLFSSNKTFINGNVITPKTPYQIKVGDRIRFGGSVRFQVVENEQDTISPEDTSPPKEATTTQQQTVTPAPARTMADSVYLAASWLFSGQTVVGKVYRVVIIAAATAFVVGLVELVNSQ
jgi:pSer/pThr/pTyr-binding forkhead associated (FHA) protein